jgi:hypothetical protein
MKARILARVSREIEHLANVAEFLVAGAQGLSVKLMDKIRVEFIVVTKKLRTRLLNGSAGNWPIPRSIDPHAHALTKTLSSSVASCARDSTS